MLGVVDVAAQRALTLDHFAQPPFDLVQLTRADRVVAQIAQRVDLSAHPAVIDHQITDVLQQQIEQGHQTGAYFGLIIHHPVQAVDQVAQAGGEIIDAAHGHP